ETGVITLSHEIQSKPPYDKRSFYISKVGFPTLISCPVFGVHYKPPTHQIKGTVRMLVEFKDQKRAVSRFECFGRELDARWKPI
ncbi:MAG: hypothetical protein M1511_09890, partial [Deltaproteobacteria bacterium]|nr:hypothetical protein [Deltaproteobacteria bacterium]